MAPVKFCIGGGVRVQSAKEAQRSHTQREQASVPTCSSVPCHLVVLVVVHTLDDVNLARLKVILEHVGSARKSYAHRAIVHHLMSTTPAKHLQQEEITQSMYVPWTSRTTYHNPTELDSSPR